MWQFPVPVLIITMPHYNDVVMSAMASQITSLMLVFLTVYSRCRSKKTLKLRVTGLCEGNSPRTGEFPAQRASNVENVSMMSSCSDGSASGGASPSAGTVLSINKVTFVFLIGLYYHEWFRMALVDEINGLVQDRNISIANALEILQSCSKPWDDVLPWHFEHHLMV